MSIRPQLICLWLCDTCLHALSPEKGEKKEQSTKNAHVWFVWWEEWKSYWCCNLFSYNTLQNGWQTLAD